MTKLILWVAGAALLVSGGIAVVLQAFPQLREQLRADVTFPQTCGSRYEYWEREQIATRRKLESYQAALHANITAETAGGRNIQERLLFIEKEVKFWGDPMPEEVVEYREAERALRQAIEESTKEIDRLQSERESLVRLPPNDKIDCAAPRFNPHPLQEWADSWTAIAVSEMRADSLVNYAHAFVIANQIGQLPAAEEEQWCNGVYNPPVGGCALANESGLACREYRDEMHCLLRECNKQCDRSCVAIQLGLGTELSLKEDGEKFDVSRVSSSNNNEPVEPSNQWECTTGGGPDHCVSTGYAFCPCTGQTDPEDPASIWNTFEPYSLRCEDDAFDGSPTPPPFHPISNNTYDDIKFANQDRGGAYASRLSAHVWGLYDEYENWAKTDSAIDRLLRMGDWQEAGRLSLEDKANEGQSEAERRQREQDAEAAKRANDPLLPEEEARRQELLEQDKNFIEEFNEQQNQQEIQQWNEANQNLMNNQQLSQSSPFNLSSQQAFSSTPAAGGGSSDILTFAACNYNSICDDGETATSCNFDCGSCGDAVCGFEERLGYNSCPQDCTAETEPVFPPDNIPYCGDNQCNGQETALTCGDCNTCGDSFCGQGENEYSCNTDCGYCGDAVCGSGEQQGVFECAVDCRSTEATQDAQAGAFTVSLGNLFQQMTASLVGLFR